MELLKSILKNHIQKKTCHIMPFRAENLESSILGYVIWRHPMKINFQNADPMAELGNFHPTCAKCGLNGVTMRQLKRCRIHAMSKFHQKQSPNNEFIQISNIYIYVYTLFIFILYYFSHIISVSIDRSPPYLPSLFHVVKSPPSNIVYLVAF